ncbi:uncharacterized protein LOC132719451 [Ruditapes philippinarum]|uniref:uncharacterized protein LOC132719451 n=1 Tax=Ruditapes philippinarum TaxID=129788 RepID=UPI00295AEA9B|nr:uncharacterized protein LOC132719451 [Ruditapes philippinarum]
MEVSGKKLCYYCKLCEQLKTPTYSDGFCSQCEEEMCQRCFDTHKQFKLNRGHRLVQSVEAKPKSKETPTFDNCTKHLNEGIKFFCPEHGQVGCGDCMVVSNKPGKVEYILEHIDGYIDSKEFKQLKKDIENNDNEATAMLGSIKLNKDHVKDVNKKFAHDVKLFRDEVISHITKLADAMLIYGDDTMASDLEKLENLEKENKSLVDDTNCMRDTLQSEADQPYNLFISSLSYKQNLHLIHEQLERIKENNTIETYDFTPDSCLSQLMKTCKQLGALHRSGNEFDNELREKMENVSGSQSRSWSPNDLEIFQHPMCMISAVTVTNEIGEETKILLKSEEKVFDQIAKIDWPIVVVAIAGLYRTGKSYLMNRLANSSKGFALGDTTELKTKGIWAWCKIHPTMSNTVLLLLDTEGLGDVEKGDPSYDNKILTLATLLCNCLVYNMDGAFDNDAVSKLTFVTEMASNIKFRGQSSEDNQSINLILPDFVLCLRDFSLKLIKGGKKITENDYLEQSLAENKSKAEQFNRPRECIRKYFSRRECFAFPVPGDGDVLENLETLSFTNLSTRFQEVTTRFTSYIYQIPPKELLVSKPINGQMFVTLAGRYITAIKYGAVLDVDDAFTAVAKIENAKIEEEALEIFKIKREKNKPAVSKSVLGNFKHKPQG